MLRPDYLLQIQDSGLPIEHRMTLLAQFVVLNGQDAPVDLLPRNVLPRGYVFRARVIRDLFVCLAITERESSQNPKAAVAESAQMWQLGLDESEGINPSRSGVVCTLHGALTKVTQVNDRRRAQDILQEWTETPPTPEEITAEEITSVGSSVH